MTSEIRTVDNLDLIPTSEEKVNHHYWFRNESIHRKLIQKYLSYESRVLDIGGGSMKPFELATDNY